MKKAILFIVSIFIIISCSDNESKKIEKAVSDYEQTLGNSKIDLSLKVQKVEKLSDYYAKDSIQLLNKYLIEEKNEKLEYLNEALKKDLLDSIKYTKEIKNSYDTYGREFNESMLDMALNGLKSRREAIKLYNTDFKGTYLEPTYLSLKKFEANPNEIIYSLYKVNYTIKNPLLNNAEQEITNTYQITSSESNNSELKVIGKLDN